MPQLTKAKIDLLDKNDSVHYSMDYKAFSFIAGNRDIDDLHVKDLLSKINITKLVTPILVDKQLHVIDGQHRLEVCRLLKMPVPFSYVSTKTELQTRQLIAVLNSTMKNWGLPEFMNNYCHQGLESYIEFRRIYVSHNFPVSFILSVLSGDCKMNHPELSEEFKGGRYKLDVDQITEAEKLFNNIVEIQAISERWNYFSGSLRFLYALAKCMKHPMYSQTRMLDSLERNPDFLTKSFSTAGYVYLLNTAYNRYSSAAEHISFTEVLKDKQARTAVEIENKIKGNKK